MSVKGVMRNPSGPLVQVLRAAADFQHQVKRRAQSTADMKGKLQTLMQPLIRASASTIC